MSMVETVARAICKASGEDPDQNAGWHLEPQRKLWENYQGHARFVIVALRDFDPFTVETKYPKPMFFDDAWVEVFEAGIGNPETWK